APFDEKGVTAITKTPRVFSLIRCPMIFTVTHASGVLVAILTSPRETRRRRAYNRLLPDAFNQAAIDAQYTASDVTGRRPGQESDDARELVRSPIAPSWNCRYRRAHNFIDRFSLTLSSLRVQLVDTLSLDPSRHQHVDRDAVGSDLGSNRLGPAYE